MKKSNATVSPEIRLIDMTSGELIGMINDMFETRINDLKVEIPSIIAEYSGRNELCRNREDIAQLLGVTSSTVWRYFRDGVFGDSVIKEKGKMVGKKSEILEAVRKYNKCEDN